MAPVLQRVTDSSELRDKAREILSEDRFRARHTPSPFRGLLRWLGDRLSPIFGPIERFFARFGWLWANTFARVFLVVAVALLVGALSLVIIRRRSAVGITRQRRSARWRA